MPGTRAQDEMIGSKPGDADLSGERYPRIRSSAYNLASSGEKLLVSGRTKGLHKDLVLSKPPSLLPTILPVITDYTRFTIVISTLFNTYNRTHPSHFNPSNLISKPN